MKRQLVLFRMLRGRVARPPVPPRVVAKWGLPVRQGFLDFSGRQDTDVIYQLKNYSGKELKS